MADSNNSGAESLGAVIGAIFVVAAVLAGLALFISVGALYGSGVGFVNYWRALMNNVEPESPQP